MRTRPRPGRIAVAIVTALLALVAAACGGDSGGDGNLFETIARAAQTSGSADTVHTTFVTRFEDVPTLDGVEMVTEGDATINGSIGRGTTPQFGQEIDYLIVDGSYYYANEGMFTDEALEIARGLFGDAYEVDVWSDDDGYLRRMEYAMDLAEAPDPPAGMPTEGRIVYELTMSDYGVPISVEAPPEDEVVDFSDVN